MFAEADVLKTKIRSRLSQHDALHGYQIARTHVHYTHTLILCILSNTRAPNPPLYGILNHIHHHTNISTNISTNKHFNKQADFLTKTLRMLLSPPTKKSDQYILLWYYIWMPL